MRHRGAPIKLVALSDDLHDGIHCAMKADANQADSWFEVDTGFQQGDVNAPLLFTLYIDTVVKAFQPGNPPFENNLVIPN